MKKIIVGLVLFLFCYGLRGQTVVAYPNPFVKRTLVSYTMAIADTISLKVYDLTGAEKVSLKANYYLAIGSFQDSLFMNNFPDGIYFVILKSRTKTYGMTKVVKTAATGINIVINNSDFRIYPNPVIDKLNIEDSNTAVILSFNLYNTLGQIISASSKVPLNKQLDIAFLSPGTYYLSLLTENGNKVLKFFKL